MVVWGGKDYHGTTLPHYDPQQLNTDFHQVRLSITISGRVKLFEKMEKQEISKRDGIEKTLEVMAINESDSDQI